MNTPQIRADALAAGARELAARHPIPVDAGIAITMYVVLTLGITSQAEADHSNGAVVGALINVALLAPLAVRRRAPEVVFGLVLCVSTATALAFGPTGGEATVLVMLGTVAAHQTDARRVASAVALVTCAFVVVISVRRPDDLLETMGVGLLAISAAVSIGAGRRARREQQLARVDQLRREQAQQAQLAVTAERARIARELHDVVAHNVSVMIALADGADQVRHSNPHAAQDAIQRVAAVGREALHELRGLLGVLRNPEGEDTGRSPQPGLDELEELADRMSAAGLPSTLHCTGQPAPIARHAQMTVYRIVQEALTNALRHGRQTSRADIYLHFDTDGVALEVINDGAPVPSDGPLGRGILGMRERAATHGAQLRTEALATGGWRVATRIPCITSEVRR